MTSLAADIDAAGYLFAMLLEGTDRDIQKVSR